MNKFRDEDGWLEHLEHETEPNLREDLELLLKNSKADSKVLQSLKRTRQLVKESDEVNMPESGLVYQDLHDRIMMAIEQEDATSPRSATNAKRIVRAKWPSVFSTFGLTMMLVLISFVVLKQQNVTFNPMASTNAPQVAVLANETSVDAQTALNDDGLLGVDGDSEFLKEAAADKLDHMSLADAKAAFDSLQN